MGILKSSAGSKYCEILHERRRLLTSRSPPIQLLRSEFSKRMDTNVIVDDLGVSGNIPCQNIHKLDKNSAVMDMIYLSSSQPMLDNGVFSLSPITPDSNNESSNLMTGFTSPLTLVSSPMNEDDDGLSTPKKGVFDPFAPGPENLMMAPLSKKYLEESRNYVARRLTKDVCEDRVCESEDDKLLEVIYDSLLEVIICKHAGNMLGEISIIDSSPDAVKTPLVAPRPTAIADTCPGAPLKSVKKSRNIDLSLCRKLDFGF